MSVGTGKPPRRTNLKGIQGTVQTLIEVATETERVDEILTGLTRFELF